MAETVSPSESIHMNFRALLLFLSVAGGVLRAADFHLDLLPQLQRHCWDCHNARKAKGGVRLDGFTNLASIYRHPKLWETAVRQLEEGLMPRRTANSNPPRRSD